MKEILKNRRNTHRNSMHVLKTKVLVTMAAKRLEEEGNKRKLRTNSIAMGVEEDFQADQEEIGDGPKSLRIIHSLTKHMT